MKSFVPFRGLNILEIHGIHDTILDFSTISRRRVWEICRADLQI